MFPCADDVVITSPDALAQALPIALELRAPMLVASPARGAEVLAEIDRLGTPTIHVAGSPGIDLPATTVSIPVAPEVGLITTLAAAPTAEAGPIWLARPDEVLMAAALLPSLVAGGASVRLIDPAASPRAPELSERDLRFFGQLDPTERWNLTSRLFGPELPGGGSTLFPDRRIVAFYGSPVTFRLGLLGEQGPQATIDRIAPLLAAYQIEDGAPVVAGFELIATVADSTPGDDGDYSNELTPDELREWIDVATDNDAFVVIDLQPGRTDFLTQARRYEEFLRLPNVGLALDPEWRLEPDQVHLTQIGSVDAAEINAVGSWLAQLVRDENLPQKVFILHQFNLDMITNRALVETPPELAVVIHVDGQGPLGSKYGTFETMLGAPQGPDQQLWWGWKNFIDEDTPTARPDQVNIVEPLPVVITYQ